MNLLLGYMRVEAKPLEVGTVSNGKQRNRHGKKVEACRS